MFDKIEDALLAASGLMGGGGGGGGSATLIEKSVTANATYKASDDNADGYSKVTVNVANSYTAGDEGKVVSDGALVSQSSDTATQNGTVDTTLINSLTVAVPTKDYEAKDWLDLTKPTGDIVSSVAIGSSTTLQSALQGRTGIGNLFLSEAVWLPGSMIKNTEIPYVVAPKCKSVASSFAVQDYQLLCVDIGASSVTPGNINYSAFSSAQRLATVVLRFNGVIALDNVNAFQDTRFASGKAGGTLYVPQAQIASYQAASNWSTILGYTNNQIKSIESTHTDPDAPVDLTTHYVDGTLIPT